MSGILSNAILEIADILFSTPRSIDTIIPDCAIEEQGIDRIEITQHPVEQGASITDHAFKIPARVMLHWAWSNSSPANSGPFFGLLPQFGAASEQYVLDIYNGLLALQASRVPFVLTTGKRTYPNMLLRELTQHTDRTSEYSLMVTAQCEEIIIVTLTTTPIPASAQANPKQTQSPSNTGTKTAAPAKNQSVLSQGASAFGYEP